MDPAHATESHSAMEPAALTPAKGVSVARDVGPFLTYALIVCPRNIRLSADDLEREFKSALQDWWLKRARDVLSVVSATTTPAKQLVGTYPHKELDETVVLSVTGHFASPGSSKRDDRERLTEPDLKELFRNFQEFVVASGRIQIANPHILRDPATGRV